MREPPMPEIARIQPEGHGEHPTQRARLDMRSQVQVGTHEKGAVGKDKAKCQHMDLLGKEVPPEQAEKQREGKERIEE